MKKIILLLLTFHFITLKAFASGEVTLVDASIRSKGFEAVAAKLDLGGELYNYTDTEGYLEHIAERLNEFMQGMEAMHAQGGMANPAMAFASKLDVYGKHLGLFNIEAVGTSAYLSGAQYHCKTYIYQPEGRMGLFTLMGDEPHALELLKYAPGDTDYFYSCDLSLDRLEPLARDVMVEVMGDMGAAILDQGLDQPLPEVDMTNRELLAQLNTELALIVNLGEPLTLPQMSPNMPSFEIPQINATLVMRNLAGLMDKVMQAPSSQAEMRLTKSGSLTFYSFPDYSSAIPFGEGAAFLATDSKTGFAYLSTSREHFDACFAQTNALAESSDFKMATKGLPTEGNVFNYMSSEVYKVVNGLMETASAAMPPETSFALGFYEIMFPMLGATGAEPASATIALNEAQGTWIVANSPFRPSSGAGSEAQAPVVIGLLAAMAIPAFNKVRTTSQQKAVTNNLRQFISGGQQYMLEEGTNIATYDDIVGSDRYVRSLEPINGEDYTELVVHSAGGSLTVTMSNGTVVSYEY